jgi:hypothetical protein
MTGPPTAMAVLREVHYRLDAPAGGQRPGAHRSRGGATGFEFRGHAPLVDSPDARRLDLLASLRDPFSQWQVRLHAERKAATVAVVADLSASMGAAGAQSRVSVLADLCDSLAWSACRHGDRFTFVGADEAVRTELTVPPTRSRAAGVALAARLRALRPDGRDARGLAQAHRHLPLARALVFLVSDFHLPLPQIDTVLASLAGHQVVPVVLWQPGEFDLGAQSGFAQLREPETGARQWLWWRPALRARWAAQRDARRAALVAHFRARRLRPLHIDGPYDADAVTRHFAA